MKIKRKNKIIFFILVILILIFLIPVFINLHIKNFSSKKIISLENAKNMDADFILVLGAGVWKNGKPSHMLEDRLLTGIELYEIGASQLILMSGDNGKEHYNEVKVMKDFVINKNIPKNHVFMDHAGFCTYDSCYRAKEIFCGKKIIIVTQKYHLYRAVYIANKLGLEAYGVSSTRRIFLNQSYQDIREFLARVKDFHLVLFKTKPKFLGEKIPLTSLDLQDLK